MENVRDQYERRPEVRFARDLRLHREVILSRQTDLMPAALAGDLAAHKEMMGLSELSRSFSATVRGVFGHVLDQELADRHRRAAEHAGRARTVDPWAGMLNDNGVLVFGHVAGATT